MKNKKLTKTGKLLGSSPSNTKWTPSVEYIFRSRNIHTIKSEDGWVIRREGRDHASAVFRTREEAVTKGRAIARREGVDLVIHRRDGRIQERDSFGSAARPPKR